MRAQVAAAICRIPQKQRTTQRTGWCGLAICLAVFCVPSITRISAQQTDTGALTGSRANPLATAHLNPLNAAWQAVGPAQIASQSYGTVTGRVTSIAIDPADASGNTVYLGTTGGGVWKSSNAEGAARTGAFTATNSAASSPQSLQLTGTGVDFALTANGSTTQTSSAGVEAVYRLLLSSAAGVPGTVAFTCSGVPTYATCEVNPSAPVLGGTAMITVTVATSVASLGWPQHPSGQAQTWLALLLPLGLLGLGRRRQLGWAAMLCCVLLVAGCGASRMIPQTTSGGGTTTNPTPSGSYTIAVSGNSAGLTRSVNLTLIVQ